MGHDKGRVSVAGQLESWGHWEERTARGMQALHHVGRNGMRAIGSNERVLSQGGKMLRFVFYKEHYSCRVQNGLERRADARKTSQKIVEVIRTPYTETLDIEGGEQGTDCGIIGGRTTKTCLQLDRRSERSRVEDTHIWPSGSALSTLWTYPKPTTAEASVM